MASSTEIFCSSAADVGSCICQHMDAYSLDMGCYSAVSMLQLTLYDKEAMTMKNSRCCPKCRSRNIVRVPNDAHRYLSNSIYITKLVTVERVAVVRYVCCDCGYIEDWVENSNELNKIKKEFG